MLGSPPWFNIHDAVCHFEYNQASVTVFLIFFNNVMLEQNTLIGGQQNELLRGFGVCCRQMRITRSPGPHLPGRNSPVTAVTSMVSLI